MAGSSIDLFDNQQKCCWGVNNENGNVTKRCAGLCEAKTYCERGSKQPFSAPSEFEIPISDTIKNPKALEYTFKLKYSASRKRFIEDMQKCFAIN